VDRRREAAITEAVENFIDLARAAQNIEVAKIRVIKPLTAEEETALVKKLETMTGKKIEPMYYTDPSILGGVVIQIGDQVIDGSLKRQIRNMEHALLQGSVANEVTD
ncbi:MAG: ATP synthase F1 subunit delta, partial [Megasphaera micronuciformis]|nr:ATP synthase F1 subunit delta [Megasphaera micronuciformis]